MIAFFDSQYLVLFYALLFFFDCASLIEINKFTNFNFSLPFCISPLFVLIIFLYSSLRKRKLAVRPCVIIILFVNSPTWLHCVCIKPFFFCLFF